jgi:hypothetical protein
MHARDYKAAFPIITQAADPGDGTPYQFTFTDKHRRLLINASFLLTTAVAVANRCIIIRHYPTVGLSSIVAQSGFVQVASLAWIYNFGVGLNHASVAVTGAVVGLVSAPLPSLDWFYPNDIFELNVQGLQGADEISSIKLRWLIQPAPRI